MRKQSTPINLRDREIKEILDEDLKYYRQVLEREFQQSRLMNETYAPPNRQEKQIAFNINSYFNKLQQQADMITNLLVNRERKEKIDLSGLIASYQELVKYLEVFAGYGSLNQRDNAVIENKFDAIAPQIDQIATQSVSLQIPNASYVAQLSKLLDNRHYILLRDNEPIKISALPLRETVAMRRERIASQREATIPLSEADSDSPFLTRLRQSQSQLERARSASAPIQQPPETEAEYAPFEESGNETSVYTPMTEPGVPRRQWDRTISDVVPRPRNLTEGRQYLKSLPRGEANTIAQDLGFYEQAKAKSSTSGMNNNYTFPEILAIYTQRERDVRVMLPQEQEEAQAEAVAEAEDAQENTYDDFRFIPEEELEGEGRRRRKLGILCGAGESEDMMYGRPAGLKKALLLRPMDRQPVRFKTADQRGEAGLSLENRMMFLNQLDSKPVKDELEINSTSSYKKAMSEKAKKMAKMKGKEF